MVSRGTKTSDFGAPKRENHDSTKFYTSQLYVNPASTKSSDDLENVIPKNLINKVILGDSRNLSKIPDLSIHLVVTSPPYNVSKQYDEDLSLVEYISLIREVFEEIYPKLVDGGRICINLANIGRKPYIPLTDQVSKVLTELGYIQRGEVIWDKGASAGSSCAWGSWKSASNPVLRDVHEYILIFSKGTLKRTKGERKDTISRDEFMEYTKSIWKFFTVSARKIGHPAPFPEELPFRCIQLYSYENDVVFDPFMGAGTTGLAALKIKRNFLGYEIKEEYVDLATDRIDAWKISNQ